VSIAELMQDAASRAVPGFEPFPKIARFRRSIIITEKLDGTNGQIYIDEDGNMYVGSRTRWITPGKSTDNYGFAAWAHENRDELLKLGPGRHFGEWWGQGIQRKYGMDRKVFSLFNVDRWSDDDVRPSCCSVVPVLYRGDFSTLEIDLALHMLDCDGSVAANGFDQPEGIVIFHPQARHSYKVTLDGDGHKGQVAA